MSDPNLLGLGLLYVGAVLFVNALYIMGYATAKDTAVINLFAGALTFLNAAYFVFVMESAFAAAQTLLFSFTYLWLFVAFWWGIDDNRALGFYCLFVAVTAAPTAAYTFMVDKLAVLAVIWAVWAYLWFVFFLLMGLRLEIKKLAAWSTMAVAIITGVYAYYILTVPGAPI